MLFQTDGVREKKHTPVEKGTAEPSSHLISLLPSNFPLLEREGRRNEHKGVFRPGMETPPPRGLGKGIHRLYINLLECSDCVCNDFIKHICNYPSRSFDKQLFKIQVGGSLI